MYPSQEAVQEPICLYLLFGPLTPLAHFYCILLPAYLVLSSLCLLFPLVTPHISDLHTSHLGVFGCEKKELRGRNLTRNCLAAEAEVCWCGCTVQQLRHSLELPHLVSKCLKPCSECDCIPAYITERQQIISEAL